MRQELDYMMGSEVKSDERSDADIELRLVIA